MTFIFKRQFLAHKSVLFTDFFNDNYTIDIEQWCGATLQELSHAALDRQRWAAIVTMASDTNGH